MCSKQHPRGGPTIKYIRLWVQEPQENLYETYLKSYFCQIGYRLPSENGEFKTKVTDTIAWSKGLTLKYQNKGLINKNVMREFLKALAKDEKKELSVEQFRFQISKNTYNVVPKHYKKCIETRVFC